MMVSQSSKGASMRTESRVVNGVAVVAPHGQLMGGTSTDDLDKQLSDLLGHGAKRVVVDLGDTRWINSAGLGLLIHQWKAFDQAGADLRLANLTKKALDILVISRLSSVFSCYETTDDAISSYA